MRELVDKFEGRLITEVRRQEGIDQRQKVKLNPKAEEFKRSKLLEKYITKLLFGQDDKKLREKLE